MPKRSNTFQKLIAAVHKAIGHEWTVAESVELKDSLTGQNREVDVVAQSIIQGYSHVLSIECRDHKRKADVTWVDCMATKHQFLPTTKLVLWSRSGFFSNAVDKARALKIDVRQGDTKSADWTKIAKALVGAKIKFVAPHFKPFIDIKKNDGSRERIEPSDSMVFGFDVESCDVRIVDKLQELYAMPQLGTAMLDHTRGGKEDFYIECKFPGPVFIWDSGQRLGELLRLGIGMVASTDVKPLEVRSVLHESTVHTLATSKILDGEITIHFTERSGRTASLEEATFKKHKVNG
jgi:hypothetical protein